MRDAGATIVIGFTFAILVTIGFAAALEAVGFFPDDPLDQDHPLDRVHLAAERPQLRSVGFLAGIAGVLSLTSAKSGALIGVLISVTTIPAAAAIAVAVAGAEWDQAGSSTVQLLVNLISIIAGGVITLSVQLAVQRRADVRRHRRDATR